MTVTCSAQDVIYMQWSIHTFPFSNSATADFNTILRSGVKGVEVAQGITLYSEIATVSKRYYSTVSSTMTVSLSLSEQGEIDLYCIGRTQWEPIFETATVFDDFFSNCKQICSMNVVSPPVYSPNQTMLPFPSECVQTYCEYITVSNVYNSSYQVHQYHLQYHERRIIHGQTVSQSATTLLTRDTNSCSNTEHSTTS